MPAKQSIFATFGGYIRVFIDWLLMRGKEDNDENDGGNDDEGDTDLPDKRVYIDSTEAAQIVKAALGARMKVGAHLHLPDLKYYCPSLEYTKKVMKESLTETMVWTEEIFDCDDFAIVLKADFAKDAYRNLARRSPHCFGIVWGSLPGPHAINWVITDDKQFWFVEPQNDTIYKPSNKETDVWMLLA